MRNLFLISEIKNYLLKFGYVRVFSVEYQGVNVFPPTNSILLIIIYEIK